MIPNTFAYVMLWLWPLVCILLFATRPARQAALWSVLGGILLLPSAAFVKIPGTPDLNKNALIAIGLVIGGWLIARRSTRAADFKIYLPLCALFLLSPLATAIENPDPIVGSGLYITGMKLYDGFSQMAAYIFMIVPFWLARRLLADEDGHRLIVTAVLMAMLAYTVPILFEIRFSPQLHTWVYGFFPHSFGQQMRDGGFRAVVFMNHGLVVALYLAFGFIAAIVAQRARFQPFGIPGFLIIAYLAVVMLLQKSLGAAVLGFAFGAAVYALRPRRQVTLAVLVALAVLVYPMLRGAHVVPVDLIRATTASVSADRTQSFQFRLDNEELLLKKAAERPWLGWGTWGRNRVYDRYTGKDVSVTDGTWVIAIGQFGWIGYLALFGMMTVPLLRLRRVARDKRAQISPYTAGLAMMLAVNLLDLLPNSSITPLTMLMAGALTGRAVRRSQPARAAAVTTDEDEDNGENAVEEATPASAPVPVA